MMRLKQIPKQDLVSGVFYLGRGRNGNVGMWDKRSDSFLVPSWKFKMAVIKYEGYFEREEGGCFQPFMAIDEGKLEDLYPNEWGEYGDTLILGNPDEERLTVK
jgi:hypothetical protein